MWPVGFLRWSSCSGVITAMPRPLELLWQQAGTVKPSCGSEAGCCVRETICSLPKHFWEDAQGLGCEMVS